MLDVTDIVLSYREATRHLWNTYFMRAIGSPFENSNLDRYEEIDKLLFTSLVLEPIGKATSEFAFRQDAHPSLHVLPCEGADALRLRISDSSVTRSRSWNEPINVPGARGAVFEFIECFDWDRYRWVSFPYYRVRISSFPSEKHLENLEALVEVQMVRVYETSGP